MKRIYHIIIITIFLIVFASPAYGIDGIPAYKTTSSIYIDDDTLTNRCIGYNIKGNNYFKIRDLADALNGSGSQFDVSWNDIERQVEIVTGKVYDPRGSSSYYYTDSSQTAYPTQSPVIIDGEQRGILAYNIKGNNYFKLRDLAEIFSYDVDWSQENNSIYIGTKLPEGAYRSDTGAHLELNRIPAIFNNTGKTINSYMVDNGDGTFFTVDVNGSVNIETYDSDLKLLKTKQLDHELPIFGSFYAGSRYNYIAWGQENNDEKDNREVFRVVKYDKNFNRMDSISLNGGECFTTEPFYGGSGRMSEWGNRLVFHTSRKKYTTEDGKNHQSQLTMIIDIEEMVVLNETRRFQTNNVSHSFNQFVLFDNNLHVLLDHGDAYPRSLVIHRENSTGGYDQSTLLEIPGEEGANFTGISVGGFEKSRDGYLVAFNSIDQSQPGEYLHFGKTGMDIDERDVVVIYDDMDSGSVNVETMTDYIGSDRYASVPRLVKVNDNFFAVLWQEIYHDKSIGDVKYVFVNGKGNALGKINTLVGGMLTDCQPLVMGNKIAWYKNSMSCRVFYTLDIKEAVNIY